jgi:TatA/E family protein of Tat protein translocase
LLLILVIALIVIGPGKLPEVGAAIGKSFREFQKASGQIQDSISAQPTAPAQQQPQPTAAPQPPAQSYYAAQPGSGQMPNPAQQPYPGQLYSQQGYPPQPPAYPAQQPYPGQPYPQQGYPPQPLAYPAQQYGAPGYPAAPENSGAAPGASSKPDIPT